MYNIHIQYIFIYISIYGLPILQESIKYKKYSFSAFFELMETNK